MKNTFHPNLQREGRQENAEDEMKSNGDYEDNDVGGEGDEDDGDVDTAGDDDAEGEDKD